MRPLFLVLVIHQLATASVFATAQRPDKILYEGKTYSLHTNPLEPYFAKHPDKRPKSNVTSSALWRGYVATFEVTDGRLALNEIKVATKQADETFPYSWTSVKDELLSDGETLIIDWFSGILVLPHGELVSYVHMGYGSTYSDYILLAVRDGNVTDKRTFDAHGYQDFRERQFQAYKKTADYRERRDELSERGWPMDRVDSFLRSVIVRYTSEFLDDETPVRGER